MTEPRKSIRYRSKTPSPSRIKTAGQTFEPLGDLYFALITGSFWRFLMAVAIFVLLINTLFAVLYLVVPGCIANARPGSFEDAFFFSVQTFATIGYGIMSPNTLYAHIVVTIESVLGILAVGSFAGIAFARLSRPTARVLFSDKLVIRPRNGVPHLQFRVANWRNNLVIEAQVRLYILMTTRTTEGETVRSPTDLKLLRSSTPVFFLTWTVMHPIDESSPFYGEDAIERLRATGAQLFASVTGYDQTLGQTVHAYCEFPLADIVPNAKFLDVVVNHPDGRREIDFSAFHEVEPLPPALSPLTRGAIGPKPRTMNPVAMAAIIIGLHAVFFYSALRRWDLLNVGRWINRFDRIPDRVRGVIEYAFAQKKMHYYRLAGLAHQIIFLGFLVLLLRTTILWGRGFYAPFSWFILGPEQPLGMVYELLKDIFAMLVIAGASTFVYLRVVKKTRRMTLSGEALLILGIILTMMVSDILYDGAMLTIHARYAELGCSGHVGTPVGFCETAAKMIAPLSAPSDTAHYPSFHVFQPAGSIAALILGALPLSVVAVIGQAGFWAHSSLVLIFLNILPYSKHFHIITAIPNVFLRDINPPGRLPPMAKNSDELMEIVGAAAEKTDPLEDAVGVARIDHFTWKAVLDFYTCTECGRCSDNCPAHRTGKILSPKQLTLNLRNFMYENDPALVKQFVDKPKGEWLGKQPGETLEGEEANDGTHGASGNHLWNGEHGPTGAPDYVPMDLVPNVIHPDVLWACTTCRACEEQCPVMISYVDKIVSLRRNLVVVKGEFPAELQKPFNGMETNGNPWNLSRMDRSAWSEGLGIKTMSEKPDAKVLYWVGCAASYDDRAKKIARATARLLQKAGVDFAILGEEETCTGDPARRAGNEYLFLMLAEQNAATLNGYKEKGGAKTVITACPHCFNTLKNEYPDVGATLEVVHHTDYLLGLLTEKKLSAKKGVKGKVVYHDSCYLGRYNGVYESPREILRAIPGVELVEVDGWNKKTGLCCGAGGAQMWMEEQNKDRVNVKRTLQLVGTQAKTIASACPFCMTMLTDGLKSQELEAEIRQMDVAELLAESCLDETAKPKGDSPEDAPARAAE